MAKFKNMIAMALLTIAASGMTVQASNVESAQDLLSNATSGKSEVVYDTASEQEFTVIIPKKIILGSDKKASYNVTVKGDVAQGSRVKVEPQDDVEDRDGINFVMTAEKSGGSKSVDVTQNVVYWDYNDIVANEYSGTAKSGNVNGSELTFGIWSGTLTFLINFEDEYGEADNGIAPQGAINDYQYELDEVNKVVTLNHYIGNASNVRVYNSYPIGDDVYRTAIGNTTNNVSLFSSCTNVESISFDKVDTSGFIDASYMFYECYALTTLDLSNLDTSNVVDMNHMFESCRALKSPDLSGLNTSNVTDMSNMFLFCMDMGSLDLSNFDTSNVTDMNNMFNSCTFTTLDVSNFDTTSVTNMNSMFGHCEVDVLDLSSFDTHNVTIMAQMFKNNSIGIIYVNQDKWSTSQANASDMFYQASWCGSKDVTYK